jgi:hypothetical protein
LFTAVILAPGILAPFASVTLPTTDVVLAICPNTLMERAADKITALKMCSTALWLLAR